MGLTRRALLEQIGRVGGLGAAYMAMETLGLAIPTPAEAESFALPTGSGGGRSVVILGAGIAGLVSAYELQRAGYRVTLLEARDRIGGRSWTIRGGTRIEQMGRPDQQATFDPGLYLNPGPARIPSTHRAILGYARRFGVRMEPFINTNRNASWDFAGKVHQERRMVEDFLGHMTELLAKAIDQHALDQFASKDELELLRQMLPRDGKYVPQGQSGYSVEPGGYAQAGVPLPALPFNELVPNQAIFTPYGFEHIFDMQPTMLQPVGGMDRIAHAIYEQVKPVVRLNAPVTAIRRSGDRVRIEHGPGTQMTEADYAVVTIPAVILERIPSDFSPEKKKALKGIPYLHSVKVGFEAPRFWETDDNLFGGLAWTDRANENVIYPSDDIGAPKGVLVAAYVAGWTNRDNPEKFQSYSHEQRFQVCRDSIEALHPGKSRLMSNPVTVAWGLTRYSEGVGALWPDDGTPGASRGAQYAELLKPEGPIVFAGEHLSYQGLWQEGAAVSAHEALKLIAAMARARAA